MAERGYRLKLETAEEVSLRANVPRLHCPDIIGAILLKNKE